MQEKARKKNCVVIHRQTVRYVTAHDTHAFTKKSSSGIKSYLISEIFHSARYLIYLTTK